MVVDIAVVVKVCNDLTKCNNNKNIIAEPACIWWRLDLFTNIFRSVFYYRQAAVIGKSRLRDI